MSLRTGWTFGVFGAAVTTFPPELQRGGGGRNALLERAPHLAVRATVSLTSAYARVFPDASLRGVGRGGAPIDGALSRSRAWTRRLPDGPFDGPAVAWRDGERVGVSRGSEALVLPRVGRVSHVHVFGGREPGRWEVSLGGVSVVTHTRPLAAAAEMLGTLWGLPVTHEEVDEG